jgi:hypothetical protein
VLPPFEQATIPLGQRMNEDQAAMRLRLATNLAASVLLLTSSLARAADEGPPTNARQAAPALEPAFPKQPSNVSSAAAPLFVGLRRSSYGLRKQNSDDTWWLSRAKTFATNFPGAQPLILQIISNYQDDGSTEIEFRKPEDYRGTTTNMTFRRGNKLNHEQALTAYDTQGVKAILQFEPGNADVAACFELAHQAFRKHPCVIGLAIDTEWFRTKESSDLTGLPIPDAEAQRWMEQVLRFNPSWLLVLKHFEPKHLPQKYRHPNLWLLTDSQEFASQAEWMTDMREWAAAFKGASLGAQFGYAKDQKWWVKTALPPVDLGRALLHELPEYRMILWVDFTANRVDFGQTR